MDNNRISNNGNDSLIRNKPVHWVTKSAQEWVKDLINFEGAMLKSKQKFEDYQNYKKYDKK